MQSQWLRRSVRKLYETNLFFLLAFGTYWWPPGKCSNRRTTAIDWFYPHQGLRRRRTENYPGMAGAAGAVWKL